MPRAKRGQAALTTPLAGRTRAHTRRPGNLSLLWRGRAGGGGFCRAASPVSTTRRTASPARSHSGPAPPPFTHRAAGRLTSCAGACGQTPVSAQLRPPARGTRCGERQAGGRAGVPGLEGRVSRVEDRRGGRAGAACAGVPLVPAGRTRSAALRPRPGLRGGGCSASPSFSRRFRTLVHANEGARPLPREGRRFLGLAAGGQVV